MKTTGKRSAVLHILLALFIGGTAFLLFKTVLFGGEWVMRPYNGHIYAEGGSVTLGDITDRNGVLLASTQDGMRIYNESETVRISLIHTVGDTAGYIGTSVQATQGDKLSGYNFITGIADLPFDFIGKDVELTLDADICVAAYNAMSGYDGAVMVYNYKTGDIIAKVSKPGFDPENVPEDIDTNEAYKGAYIDMNLSGSFAPGSIFKVVTAAAAMEAYPDSWTELRFSCSGAQNIGGSDITCIGVHGNQDIFAAFGNSCNIYFAELAQQLGGETIQNKAEDMGFNRSLTFDGIPVAKSTIDLSAANANELGWAAVGQYTVQANPYHMLALMGAVANGGEYVEPRLTQSVNLIAGLNAGSRKLLTEAEAANLKALLRSNVQNYYGDWIFPSGWEVCAKTGTAEVGEGKAPTCWMIGFCGNEDAPYAFVVMAEEGNGGIETAGNIASTVLNAIAQES